jgi:hypothetical protein
MTAPAPLDVRTASAARLVVVGSRGHKLGRSMSCGVIRAAGRPVVVAPNGGNFAIAARAA